MKVSESSVVLELGSVNAMHKLLLDGDAEMCLVFSMLCAIFFRVLNKRAVHGPGTFRFPQKRL